MNQMKKVYVCFPQGKAKALTMSYDDGKKEDIRLIDIFNKYGIKGTFNLNYGMTIADQTGQPHPRVPKEQVAELYKGHEVATHTMTHPTIARCPMTEVAAEILEDRRGLEEITGTIVRGHAYPNGSYSNDIKQLFKQLGVAYARVTEPNASYGMMGFSLPEDLLEWHPTCHHTDPKFMEYAKYFAEFKKKQYLKLMYVWGHSYEFADNDNWELIEEFCKYMGGRDDIWYATNIEIADYMDVMKMAQFSVDNTLVYNPCVKSLWLMVDDDECVEVKGGEMVKL